MKRLFIKLSFVFGLFFSSAFYCQSINPTSDTNFRMGMQSYSFHRFSLVEALDKTQQLGLKYIEVYPGHPLGGKWGDKVFNFNLDQTARQEIKQLAAEKGIKIIACGVFTTENSADWEKFFRFAKDMDMEFITCEPALKDWDLVENLSNKYGIKVAVHNHPKPSEYWTPDSLLKAISNRSSNIGSCADVGHWRREGLDQLDCLRKVGNRLISFHFKDIQPKIEGENEQKDTIWGKGILNVKEMVKMLYDNQFTGVLSIEYENNWDNSVGDIRQCINYFEQCKSELQNPQ